MQQPVAATCRSDLSHRVSRPLVSIGEKYTDENKITRINLPFKNQVSSNAVRKQMRDLSHKLRLALLAVFISRNLNLKNKILNLKKP